MPFATQVQRSTDAVVLARVGHASSATQTLGIGSKLMHVAAAQTFAEPVVTEVLVGDASLRVSEPIVFVVLVRYPPIVAHARKAD